MLLDKNPAVTFNYGNLLQVTFDFLIVSSAVFVVIKAMNAAKKNKKQRLLLPMKNNC